jgi:hypothetical protein
MRFADSIAAETACDRTARTGLERSSARLVSALRARLLEVCSISEVSEVSDPYFVRV